MAVTKMFVERRSNPRYPIKEGAVVFNEAHLGEIIDISVGGMSFRTVDDGARTGEVFDLNILFGADGFSLSQLPCKSVADFVITRELVPDTKIERRICVQFRNLSAEKKSQLIRFISSYADHKAEAN